MKQWSKPISEDAKQTIGQKMIESLKEHIAEEQGFVAGCEGQGVCPYVHGSVYQKAWTKGRNNGREASK